MTKRLGLAAAALLSLLVSMLIVPAPAHAAVGLRVSGTKILEANGNAFVMRGVSHAHTWYTSQTSSFANIKALRANTVRVVLSGGRWTPNNATDVANVVSLCRQNRLICVLENHDTTGYGEQSGAYTLDQAVDYWSSVRSALTGTEDFIIVNIGNEPYGNNNVSAWTAATSNAITRMRSLGFQHMLMVDAPNWGQDWQFTMRDNAKTVAAADTQKNTVFSIHMYGVFDTAAEITAYLDAFQTAGLPLVIGEFGFNHSDGDPDEDTIMAQAVSRGIGYIGWSWSGNGGGVEYLDMVTNFNPAALTSWGQRIFNGANGIAATSREATYFSGGSTDTTAPTTPGTPAASGITSTGATLTWTASTDSGGSGLAGYDVYREQGTTDPLLGSATTNSVTLTGLTPSTQYQVYVRARDGAGNQSTASALATFTTSGGGTGGGCTAAGTVQSQWNGGYVVQPVTVTNTGTTGITGWTVTFTLPAGHTLAGSWNASVSVNGQTVTARNAGYNGTVGAGASTSFGFQVTRPGGNTATVSSYTCATS
ncbi:Endo-1,4-beta-xylanase A precursor [[Actinomadura] parvosata subsp. kistnae]|uniref:Endoglucanase n=1 Tax=[Actinomadura] parvosata subsp. kistnae TaxID=1909395 RepID=A0A1V0AE33_9ACTN|nr:cellulase family glycosylhydrolase [Nonomuraea sp. ATCC 55076]AQZ68439.1 beta-mannosidase [Nonomuraea sp. ATCC 55076]SPL93115.1 Endo-1,4-beta-xylanase A precursor [Actinomadura parvosata subsp. kistnae]